jgi:hypothetical protein
VRLRVDFVATVAKDVLRQDLNEDANAIGDTCIAVADGASESFDSKTWAQLIAHSYIQDPHINATWAVQRTADYQEKTDLSALSWAQQAAYERGSFTTLLGIRLLEGGHDVQLTAIGDSLALHIRDSLLIASFPFTTPAEFDAPPHLLSTLTSANGFLEEPDWSSKACTAWAVQPSDQILIVTDAVGHWLLSHLEALPSLIAVTKEEEFQQVVKAQRAKGLLRLDDSTLVRIRVEATESEPSA